MTDLLTPEDTGEIPAVDPGPDTRNLPPYTAGLGPALRRSSVELPTLAGYRATLAGELVPTYPESPDRPFPDPKPKPGPPPPRGWFARLRYRGAHRARGMRGAF